MADVLPALAVIVAAAAVGLPLTRLAPLPLAVFLLAVGVAAGPEGLDLVRVDELSELTEVIVTVAVALIVFEGGTALRWATLRSLARPIRRLVAIGLVVTTVLGMVLSHVVLDFPWALAAMFGATVSVTGPSVLTPLLGSLRCNERLRTTMLGEGVIIDPLAALLTLALLHAAVAPHEGGVDLLAWVLARVGVGLAVGTAMAVVAHFALRRVPEVSGREVAIAVVASALIAYAIAEEIAPEAGLTTAVVLGIALGNLPYPHQAALRDFQEAVVVFLLASVYVLLAASIELGHVGDVLPGGLVVILVLAAVARPAVVAVATAGSPLTRGERILMAAVAPRGVVAASLAAFVAAHAGPRLGEHGDSFVALVFLMILMTTGLQSWYAHALGARLGVVAGEPPRGAATATVP